MTKEEMRPPFYSNILQFQVAYNEGFYKAIELSAFQQDKIFQFVEWLENTMWTKQEFRSDGHFTTEKWFNTHNYAAMENPLTTKELFELYLNEEAQRKTNTL